MKNLILIILLLMSNNIFAATVLSDPTAETVTSCRFFANGTPRGTKPVKSDATGKYCYFNIDFLAPGEYDLQATFIYNDGLYINESAKSNTIHVIRPSVPSAPVNLRLQ